MSAPAVRERELEDTEAGRSPKRTKVEEPPTEADAALSTDHLGVTAEDARANPSVPAASATDDEEVLPPSHALLRAPRHMGSHKGSDLRIMETDVGISEYVGHDIPKIEGIIKQRYVNTSTSTTCPP